MSKLKCFQRTQKVFDNIKRFFETAVPGWIDQHVVPILHFIEGLKAVEEGAAVVLGALFPKVPLGFLGVIDKYLDEICQALEIEITCATGPNGEPASLEDRIKCIALQLQGKHPELRHALEVKLASYLTRKTAGETQFTADQIDSIVQLTYSETKFKSAPVPDEVHAEATAMGITIHDDVDLAQNKSTVEPGIDRAQTENTVAAVENPTNAPDEALVDPTHPHWNQENLG